MRSTYRRRRGRRSLRLPMLFWMAFALLALLALVLSMVWCGALERENNSLRQLVQQQSLPQTAETAVPAGQPEQKAVTLQTWRGENEVDLHATVTLPPQELRTGQMPLVILCHGFTGNREGDGHFGPLGLRLAEEGIAVLALDFPGCGESGEDATLYTLENMQTDVRAAISYMRSSCNANGPLGLLGHSMGGRVVSLMLDDTVSAAALWSPADNIGLDGLEFLSHDPAERDSLRQTARQQGSLELSGWNVTVGSSFFEQMADSDPWQSITAYRGPLLIAFAAGDPELLSQDTINGTLQAAAARGVNFTNLYGQFTDATHNYTALDGSGETDRAVRERIESATAEFFIQALREAASAAPVTPAAPVASAAPATPESARGAGRNS